MVFLLFPALLWGGVRVMDDFNDGAAGNLFGGGEGTLSGTSAVSFVSTVAVGNTGFARGITYPATAGGHGYFSVRNADLSSFKYVSFWVRGTGQVGGEKFYCLVDDNTNFPKARVFTFIPSQMATSYQKVVISTEAFFGASLDWAGGVGGAFKIEANSDIPSDAGTIYIDDIRFGSKPAPVWWDNFNDGAAPFNYGLSFETFINPAGSLLTPTYDNTVSLEGTGYSYKIAFAYNAVSTDSVILLPSTNRGMDLSGTDMLSMHIRSDANGIGKNVGIGLKDVGGTETLVFLTTYLPSGLSASFQEVRIATSAFAGIDMSRMRSVNMWFQKSASPLIAQSSTFTLYLDNIQFIDTSSPTVPANLVSNGVAVANSSVIAATNTITVTASAGSADPTLEHVGLEYSTNAADWFRIGVDTDVADASYSFNWLTTSLSTGTNYQLRAFAEDVQGNRGAMAAFTSLQLVRSTVTVPGAISDLTALPGTNEGGITLQWTAPGDAENAGTVFGYVLKFSSMGPVTSALFNGASTFTQPWNSFVTAGQQEQRVLSGLTPSVTYWFALKAQSVNGNFSFWNSSADVPTINTLAFAPAKDAVPNAIANLGAVANSPVSILLSWTPPAPTAVNDYVNYPVYRATAAFSSIESYVTVLASVPYVSTSATVTFLDISGLLTSATYYYAVVTLDTGPVVLAAPLSNIASANPSLSSQTVRLSMTHEPLTSVGIPGSDISLTVLLESSRTITSVFLNYRRKGDVNYIRSEASPAPTQTTYKGTLTIPRAAVTNAGVEYFIIASDSYNVVSAGSAEAPISIAVSDGVSASGFLSGVVTLNDGNQSDGETALVIPSGAVADPVTITMRQENVNLVPVAEQLGNALPVAAFVLGPDGTKFKQPVQFTVRYVDLNPRDGLVDGTAIPASTLKIFWHDGFVWRPLGGKVNTAANTITGRVFHFSSYAVFSAGTNPGDSKPKEKIISPNGDGVNDVAFFDNLPDDFTIKIFDLSGRLVRVLDNTGFWDGKDDRGKIVTNGAYIYQFRINFETVTGTIGVAR